jgi:release factor glutamine methyltransferase
VIGDAALALADAGVDSARHDAEMLAAFALGVDRAHLSRSAMFDGAQFELFRSVVIRRAAREPLQYIVGTAPFRHLDVLVGPGAFVPRPETELVAGWVIDALREQRKPAVVDLCAGPGPIALSIAHEVPGAQVYAVEVDPAAASWARRNIEATGLTVTLEVADIVDAVPALNGTCDAVVANPPYLLRGSVEQPEARDFEPEIALYDEGDGLAVIRSVVTTARRLLRPHGVLAIEHGDEQAAAVTEHLVTSGFVDVEDHRDLAGRDRFATGRLG